MVGGGVYSRSLNQPQIHIWVVLFDLNLGSTLALALALVPFIYHQSSLWLRGDQLQSQLQNHIWVVCFDLNFHCIDIMLTLFYLQNSSFCSITAFQWSESKNSFMNRGCFSYNHFEYQQPYAIFKIECFVPYLHSKWSDLKNSFTNRGQFF